MESTERHPDLESSKARNLDVLCILLVGVYMALSAVRLYHDSPARMAKRTQESFHTQSFFVAQSAAAAETGEADHSPAHR